MQRRAAAEFTRRCSLRFNRVYSSRHRNRTRTQSSPRTDMASAAIPQPPHRRLPNVLLCGTGEYTTGYVDGASSTSDKPVSSREDNAVSSDALWPPPVLCARTWSLSCSRSGPISAVRAAVRCAQMGVVALTFFDLRARGLVGDLIVLCGRNGSRAAGIRAHFAATISRNFPGLDTSCDIEPSEPSQRDPEAYLRVLESGRFVAGDIAVVTTPDDTHERIAIECLRRGLSVIVAKPIVQSLAQHWNLLREAERWNTRAAQAVANAALSSPAAALAAAMASPPVVIVGEFHKRFDPLYADAISRIASGSLGELSYFHAYMSQPKSQLETFRGWLSSGASPSGSAAASAAGKGKDEVRAAPSDISFYLNSHHLDTLHLATADRSRPVWVQALAAKGCANRLFNAPPSSGAAGSAAGTGAGAPAARVSIEDTITITVQYAHSAAPVAAAASSASASTSAADSAAASSSSAASSSDDESFGIGIFTSSWIAPRSDVHTQQRFHYLGSVGEVAIDQAHRGYSFASDSEAARAKPGVQSLNPLFMRYTPSVEATFVGQQGYGYKSFEHFVEAVGVAADGAVEGAMAQAPAAAATTATGGESTPASSVAAASAIGSRTTRAPPRRRITALSPLAFLQSRAVLYTTAVLEAARRSLDEGNRKITLEYDEQRRPIKLV